MTTVGIVDYGTSNLLSVTRAFEHVGATVEPVSNAEQATKADRLVLPGVGAFGNCQSGLKGRDLWDSVDEFMRSGKPFLGICVGMQMMLDGSEEFGHYDGFGLIPGRVGAIPLSGTDGRPHKIPHIGWNRLSSPESGDNWKGTILDGVEPGASVYFVHSFTAQPQDDGHRLANTDYDGCRISAAIRRDNAYGCQFHCEKSGPVGLKIIENFLKL
ncbi:MAG: imidazole glycerol phosphate synthase subunit HisH [Proteobacteria bacterium]|nr:imidazole glycerol phosphate synthase subunit HisH [Pseudomonadota bacterium]